MKTLYNQARKIEKAQKGEDNLENSHSIDIDESQKQLFQKYEKNPIFYDAVIGKQSIEKSLEELAKVNKGIKRVLPWIRDKAHNEKLNNLGKLISKPRHLHRRGILVPDNLITMGAYIAVASIITSKVFIKGIEYNPDFSPEKIQELTAAFEYVPKFALATLTPIIGGLANSHRFNKNPVDEAKYLDEKVQQFYN